MLLAQNVRNPRFPQRRSAVHLYKILILFHCPLDGEQFSQAYGLSMFPSAEDCERAKRKSPRLRGTHKGIAYGQVDAGKGKILRTPSKANPAHITWWIYEGVEPHTFFTAYGKGGVESE